MRIGALCLLILPVTTDGQPRTYTLTGESVAIYNIAGLLRVEGGTGAAVRVEVDQLGPDGARLRVEVGMVRGRETLRVIYPGERVVYAGAPSPGRRWGQSVAKLRVAGDGTFEGDWERAWRAYRRSRP